MNISQTTNSQRATKATPGDIADRNKSARKWLIYCGFFGQSLSTHLSTQYGVLRLWPKNVPISGVITEASSVTPARLRVCSGSYGGSVFAIIRGATTDQVKHCKHCTMTAHRESDPQRKPGVLPDREPAHATRGSDGIIIIMRPGLFCGA